MTEVAQAPSIGEDDIGAGTPAGEHRRRRNGRDSEPAPRALHRSVSDRPVRLSVVVPTRNEAENIPTLLSRLGPALAPLGAEIIVVDDSDDDTAGRLAGIAMRHDVDVVIGTRYAGEGSTEGLGGAAREATSSWATRLAKSLFPRRLTTVTDPMSGLFAFRRTTVDLDPDEPDRIQGPAGAARAPPRRPGRGGGVRDGGPARRPVQGVAPGRADSGVAGYTVYRNGAAVGTSTGTRFTDTTALSETSYAYAVAAFDAAGNSSGPGAPAQVTTPAVTPVGAVADTYVKASSPTSRYGTATLVRVDGDPVTNGYLKFTVSGQTGEVLRARLRIWVEAGSSSGFVVRPVADSTWSETLTTWNTAPPIDDAAVAASGRTASGTWVTLDITPVVTGNGTFTVGLTSSGASSSSYGSRESGSPPQLLLDVSS